jgi:adenylate cyclase
VFRLSYNDATGARHRVDLADGETLIGRATNCQIVINVASVSRQHARLRVTGNRCTLADAGSSYGTQLNGAPLKGEAELKAGDTFQCGAVPFTVEQPVAEGPILTDDHQLLQDSASIVLQIDDERLTRQAPPHTSAATGVGAPPAPPPVPTPPAPIPASPVTAAASPRAALPSTPPAGTPVPAAVVTRPAERRKGSERRKAQVSFSGSERRSGRDRRQQRFLRLLSEISKTLVDVLPLAQVLSRVVDLVFEVVPAERTFLLLRDSADEAVTPRVMRARDGSTPDATLSRTIITKVMRERVAMLAEDARYDSRLDGAGSIQATVSIRSFMCAPLWNRNDVIGVLYTDNPKSKRFIAEDLDVFAALANYAAVAIEQARVAEQLHKEQQKRERLQRYHSPAVVNKIISGTLSAGAEFEAQERDVTVMFADIVGFTTRSENLTPLEVAKMLNYFFTQMAEHIFEFDGTLDKFIGDAILAVFGAPLPQDDHADRAIEAALAMRGALAEMNRSWPGDPLRMRIALNSGVALTGDIGSPRRREFTVLGDVVNACSRIESTVCKPDQIVCSRATLDRTRKPVNATSLGMVNLRGRQAEMEVFEID